MTTLAVIIIVPTELGGCDGERSVVYNIGMKPGLVTVEKLLSSPEVAVALYKTLHPFEPRNINQTEQFTDRF
ncbi:MAG: hypothetical protein NVS9B7_03900 [Flavisolibacter sp.]